MTRHQYEISALVSPTSFRGETSGGVTKCGLFSQVRILVHTIILFCITTIVILTILFTKKRTSVASWNIKIPIMGARQAADCAMQRFNILGSIDYNCTFPPDWVYKYSKPVNGIEIHILSLLEQDMIGIIFNWDISTTHPSPNPSAPTPHPPFIKKL